LSVEERQVSIDEIISGLSSGTLTEVFGAGTAAVVAPVGVLQYKDRDYRIADGGVGRLTQKFYDYLTGIQYGKEKDPFGWTEIVC